MSGHVTYTMIVYGYSNVTNVCEDMEWLQIIQLKNNDQNQGTTMYIDGRKKQQEILQGLYIVHNPLPQIRTIISYSRGVKETMYSYVPLNQ